MKGQIVLLRPGFHDFSLEADLLRSTPFELLVVDQPTDLRAAVAIITVDTAITAEIVAGLPSSCRVITRLGVGFDLIDVQACRERQITVCYVPDYGTNDVADHAVALLFAAHRRLSMFHRSIVEDRHWHHECTGRDLQSLATQTLGVIGLGRIGSAFATKMRPFVKEILAFDPNVPTNCSSIEEIFRCSDIISLHLPLTSTNHHLICAETINKMERRPILINVSRGGLVDTRALVDALNSERIAFAALDVIENEPEIDEDLIKCQRIQLTPHAAWFTRQAETSLRTKAIEDILRVLNGQSPISPVPLFDR